MQIMRTSILCLGGTFDKVYGRGANVRDFSFPRVSAATSMANRFGLLNVDVVYDADSAKDSMDMTDADRARVAEWCKNVDTKACVVVHGTDTMIETAEVVAKQKLNKAIVITGASQPAAMRDTDAEFNLGGAIIASQISIPGVYIVMNGNCFKWYACQKNPATGWFEAKGTPDSA
ncbi:MAG: asparaginase [Candidatus Andersenbacteria bacterium]|nr:asparaginase [Candidatus Andersenbacteria bacterium]